MMQAVSRAKKPNGCLRGQGDVKMMNQDGMGIENLFTKTLFDPLLFKPLYYLL